MSIISCAVALLAFTFIYLLLKRFPGKNIVEIYDVTLGRGLGFVFSFLLLISFLASSVLYAREFIDVMKVYIFQVTNIGILLGALIIVAVITAFIGLEAIVRTAKLVGYFALFSFLLLLILSVDYFRLGNIFPILGYGFSRTLTTGILRTTAYAEVVILAVFAGSLQGSAHIKKAGFISLLLSGFLLSIALLIYLSVFSYTGAEEITSLMYVLTRIVRYGIFFQRLDPLFLLLFIIVSIISVSVLFYTAVSICCKLFRLEDKRPVILPIGILTFTMAITPKDLPGLVSGYVKTLRAYGNITFFVLPFITLIIAILINKKGENPHA